MRSYYQRLEGGLLDPKGVSDGVWSVLERVLGPAVRKQAFEGFSRERSAFKESIAFQRLADADPSMPAAAATDAPPRESLRRRPPPRRRALHPALGSSSMSVTAGRARYEDPRAHALRARYLATFGGAAVPVPVEAIAEDLLGLRIEERPGPRRLLGPARPGRAPDRAERRRAGGEVATSHRSAASASRSPTSWATGSATPTSVRRPSPSTAGKCTSPRRRPQHSSARRTCSRPARSCRRRRSVKHGRRRKRWTRAPRGST